MATRRGRFFLYPPRPNRLVSLKRPPGGVNGFGGWRTPGTGDCGFEPPRTSRLRLSILSRSSSPAPKLRSAALKGCLRCNFPRRLSCRFFTASSIICLTSLSSKENPMKRKRLTVLLLWVSMLPLVAMAVAPPTIEIPKIPQPDLSKATPYSVARVIDGCSLVVWIEGKEITVSLIGVDTQKTTYSSKSVDQYGKVAYRFTTNLLKGEHVYLVTDQQRGLTDPDGRKLAFVYRAPDGLFVNAEIIRQGYARVPMGFPFKHMEEFRQLERFACTTQKGLWGVEVAGGKKSPMPTTAAHQATKPHDEAEPVTVFVTRTGDKYHSAGCNYLRRSSIPMKLKDAKAAGYTRCTVCGPPG